MSRVFLLARPFFFLALLPAALATAADRPDRSDQRQHYRNALNAIERGPADAWKPFVADLDDYPLLPYLERALLDRGRGKPTLAQVKGFLQRWPDTLMARDLRESQLRDLAEAANWAAFRDLWEDSASTELRCAWQRARIDAGESPEYARDIEALWMQPRPTPKACDPLFAWARSHGQLGDAEIWKRIDAAALAANPGTVSTVAGYLDAKDRPAAERIAASVRDPAGVLAKASAWPDTPRNRDAISFGMNRYARRDSAAAQNLWATLGNKFTWEGAQKDRVLNAIAVYRAANYADDALARLKALPATAEDDVSREWRVRVALAAQDWTETLAALEAMSAKQLADSRWRYLKARVLSKLDRDADAAPIFAAAAREANFHGFLAADWIGAPYTICPTPVLDDATDEAIVAAHPDLARAFELHALGELVKARREWNFAMEKLSERQQRLAAERAYEEDWFDRAIFLFSSSPETRTYYEQRFPLAQKSRVTSASRAVGLDPAWSYAIIRAESAWVRDARSHADAYGLMQLLPSVAKKVAQSARLSYSKPEDLFDADLNIQLGTRFLSQMAAKYSGSPWLASAAYNAGGLPVGRWIDERGGLEPDFFIETIPYKETRDYVARVLAFSVIYDWRLNGKVVPLAARLPKVGQAYKAPKDNAARKAVVCTSAVSG
jgi:soluble lytic murein transglycosylase